MVGGMKIERESSGEREAKELGREDGVAEKVRLQRSHRAIESFCLVLFTHHLIL